MGLSARGGKTQGRHTSSSSPTSEGCDPEEGRGLASEERWERAGGTKLQGRAWVQGVPH